MGFHLTNIWCCVVTRVRVERRDHGGPRTRKRWTSRSRPSLFQLHRSWHKPDDSGHAPRVGGHERGEEEREGDRENTYATPTRRLSLMYRENREGRCTQQQQDANSYQLIYINVQNLIRRALQAIPRPNGREGPTHTQRQHGQRDGSTRASHETESISHVCGKTTKRERESNP